jgi:hypothetical protein
MSALSPLLGSVDAADLRLSDRLRTWTPPRWLQVWMMAATRFGDGGGWIAVAPRRDPVPPKETPPPEWNGWDGHDPDDEPDRDED